ncbi:MAG: hypothetical protein ACD_22C00027G0002 [uncultured bacterium]|nr:MAG: hypothetical protein ACD_22C00027G0002 [uncultured bacterium]
MSTATISKEQVKKIAQLSNLALTEQEVEKFSEILSDTMKVVDVLKELDTENISETYQITGLTNVFQKSPDNTATLTQKEALQNAKEVIRGLFVTKAVFDRK